MLAFDVSIHVSLGFGSSNPCQRDVSIHVETCVSFARGQSKPGDLRINYVLISSNIIVLVNLI